MEDPFDLPPDVLRRIPLFAELSKVLSWTGGPVNWDLAKQISVSVAAGERPATPVTGTDHEEIAQHVRVAELWLAEIAALPQPSHLVPVRAATPADWAEHAPEILGELIDPVAAKVSGAMRDETGSLPGGAETAMVAQALAQMGPMFMGIQAGTILGGLAQEVTGVHESALPVYEETMLLVVPTIDGIARDYQLDRRLVRQWVALRAAAHRMACEGLSFVRTQFFSLFLDYVASLDFDFGDALRRLQELDLSDPGRIQDALGDESLFTHQSSPQTERAAARIGGFLAVLDAHTLAAAEAAGARAGDVAAAAEAFRRRGTDAGAGARKLAQFIGIEPGDERPRAQGFVREVLGAAGWTGLNRMWEEPEAFPSEDELNDPNAWLRRIAG